MSTYLSDVYGLVQKMYPSLLSLINGELFLNDSSICMDALDCKVRANDILLTGLDFSIQLCSIDGFVLGFLRMDFDFELSDATCLWLYSYGIEIKYNCPMSLTEVKYDRKLIERRNTIKNIINHGEA